MTRPMIIAYLADWADWESQDIDGEKLTHLNYAFATIEGVKVVPRVVGQDLKNIHKLDDIRARHPHLLTLISIGGWGADGFSDAALTQDSRALFADTAVAFMKEYGFHGIDIDWEYPCVDTAGIVARPEDKRNFTLLLRDVRERLNEEEKSTGRQYLLTIAVGAGQYFVDNTEMSEVVKYLDFVNVMTYDLSSGSELTTHHTNLYPSSKSPYTSGDEAIALFFGQSIPKQKLVLGAAFYGRSWAGVRDLENGLGQPGSSAHGRINTMYSNLHENVVNKNGFTRYWDDGAKAPYLYNKDIFITYDDEESIKHKTDYVLSQGLGGIMFWEYTGDMPGRLLKVMYDNLR